MKTVTLLKFRGILLALAFFAPLLVTMQANADARNIAYFPVAVCETAVNHTPLPAYICCEQLRYTRHGVHHVWRDTWVSGSCSNADARGDMGCNANSPVFGSGIPISASFCQFSYSTGKFE